ncbi:MAG: DEAD/DEAH box helicase family protein [Prevotellaceae bacterium]|jgi:superfamily II DNA or RNA helicase|nr:DEAD/DEAH box helicase family protein [Prevotellaceae bacterium]
MESNEIREIVAEILSDIDKNRLNLTYRKYDTFFERLGMLKKRDFVKMIKLNRQFKKNNIALWKGKEHVKKISGFKKGETITFRIERTDNKNHTQSMPKIKCQYAGTVHIADEESGIEPYKHQEEAFFCLQKEIIKSNKNPFAGLLVLPTGGGKTLTAAHWIAKNFLDKNKKVLWIAHRHELLEQAQKTFAEKLAFKDIFTNKKSFNYRILSGIHDKPIHIRQTDDIIISSKDSLNAGFDHLLKNWIKNNTDEIFLVIDEAHHATAKTYRKLISDLKSNVSRFRMLGLTATPFRTAEDEKGLLKKVFPDDIVYKIDLRTLIRLGILSEPRFEEVSTGQNMIEKYDLTQEQINELNLKFGDFSAILGDNIARSIAENRERNLGIVTRYVSQKEKYRQTIVFALNVDNAIALNALFKESGVKSDYVLSSIKDSVTGVTISSKENKDKIEQFRKGELEVLINVNILTEGTDVPNVQSIFLTRPTISNILMTQMMGRGLRGPKAGGTKEAYIVSFIDDWQNKVSWVNPEKLFIEENVDFNDKDKDTAKQIIRLVAINKIEEFAILNNQIIEPEIREELEKLNFIERFPVGIYQFRFLKETDSEPEARNCEILVYDNILQSYIDFVNDLPILFSQYNLTDKDFLTDKELDYYSTIVEDGYFCGCLKYPAYSILDIKDILQYYAIQDQIPPFIELKEREKYDIDKIAKDIIDRDLGKRAQADLLNLTWENNEFAWQTFFNFDRKNFIHEIDLSTRRQLYPELFKRKSGVPQDEKELRELEKLNLYELRQVNPTYEKWLRDEVFKKFTDKDGYYYSAESGCKSKNKCIFQIDHIKPMHNGGLTVLDNLQLLTRSENAIKGIK